MAEPIDTDAAAAHLPESRKRQRRLLAAVTSLAAPLPELSQFPESIDPRECELQLRRVADAVLDDQVLAHLEWRAAHDAVSAIGRVLEGITGLGFDAADKLYAELRPPEKPEMTHKRKELEARLQAFAVAATLADRVASLGEEA
jgi:hypothetical protein